MANDLSALRVVRYPDRRLSNPYPGGDLPWQVYHGVRNALVRTCRRFGPTGPMGEVRIVPDVDDLYRMLAHERDFWQPGDPDPTYYVLSDQLNHERYCYAELLGRDPLSAGWLAAVAKTLRRFDGWGLGVQNIPDSHLIVFGNQLVVRGRLARCRTPAEVVTTADRLLRTGGKRWWQFWR